MRLKVLSAKWQPCCLGLNVLRQTRSIPCLITVTSLWAQLHLKSPVSQLFAQTFVLAQIKQSIKALCHWPKWGESTGDWRIPFTKGQFLRRCFHLMMSSRCWCPGSHYLEVIIKQDIWLQVLKFSIFYMFVIPVDAEFQTTCAVLMMYMSLHLLSDSAHDG